MRRDDDKGINQRFLNNIIGISCVFTAITNASQAAPSISDGDYDIGSDGGTKP
jgi:hypothetical protein